MLHIKQTQNSFLSSSSFSSSSSPSLKCPQPPRGRSDSSAATEQQQQQPEMGKIYQLVVFGLRGEKMMVDLCNTEEQMQTMTVLQLREKLKPKLPTTVGQEKLRLIFTDKVLDDDSKLLSSYGIQNMSVIHLVVAVPGGLTA